MPRNPPPPPAMTPAEMEERTARLHMEAAEMRKEMYADLTEMRKETNADLAKMRKETRADFAEMRKEMRADFAEMRKEMRANLAEMGKKIDATLAKMTEANLRAMERHDRAMERHDRAMEEHNRAMERHDREMAEIRREWGGFNEREGHILEDDCAAAMDEEKRIGDILLTEVLSPVRSRNPECEYDIVGRTGNATVVVVEVKRTLSPEHVDLFVGDRLPKFASRFPQYARGRKVKGAIIYRACGRGRGARDPRRMALEAGVLLFRATGKNKLSPITPADLPKRG